MFRQALGALNVLSVRASLFVAKERSVNASRYFGSRNKGKIQDQKSDGFSTQGFLLDNLAEIREKAVVMEKMMNDPKVSKALLKCETSTDFIAFAETSGAAVSGTKGSHVKVSFNGVITGFQAGKVRLRPYVRKQKIDAFKAMGLAWDESPPIGLQSLEEDIRDLLLEGGPINVGQFVEKFER